MQHSVQTFTVNAKFWSTTPPALPWPRPRPLPCPAMAKIIGDANADAHYDCSS